MVDSGRRWAPIPTPSAPSWSRAKHS